MGERDSAGRGTGQGEDTQIAFGKSSCFLGRVRLGTLVDSGSRLLPLSTLHRLAGAAATFPFRFCWGLSWEPALSTLARARVQPQVPPGRPPEIPGRLDIRMRFPRPGPETWPSLPLESRRPRPFLAFWPFCPRAWGRVLAGDWRPSLSLNSAEFSVACGSLRTWKVGRARRYFHVLSFLGDGWAEGLRPAPALPPGPFPGAGLYPRPADHSLGERGGQEVVGKAGHAQPLQKEGS